MKIAIIGGGASGMITAYLLDRQGHGVTVFELKFYGVQQHHTPLYTVESFQYLHDIIATNGANNTYHVGAYLGDGLHEGAVTSAMATAKLIDSRDVEKNVYGSDLKWTAARLR